MEKKWRLIDTGLCSAFYSMALDEAIATSVRKGDSPPTLRFYGWDRPSLSLGHFQKTSGINLDYCVEHNIPVVRRPTGGRALLHDKELTYSFSVRTDSSLFSKGLLDSYRNISSAFCRAFKKINIDVTVQEKRAQERTRAKSLLCFGSSSYGEILVDNRKLVGSAQKRWQDGLLQQGSIPYCYDEELMRTLFGAQKTSLLRKCMIGIMEVIPDLEEDGFKKIISDSFEETFGIRIVLSHPSEEESHLARTLEDRKYRQYQWKHLQESQHVSL